MNISAREIDKSTNGKHSTKSPSGRIKKVFSSFRCLNSLECNLFDPTNNILLLSINSYLFLSDKNCTVKVTDFNVKDIVNEDLKKDYTNFTTLV